MDRQDFHKQAEEVQHRCILCEAEIEVVEYEIYFATGYCRYCHEAVEEDGVSPPSP